ncbi:MAG TPA: Na+/H+ antiporter NhaA [Thermoanaerobaculia bacterium]|nr:Na+/H+ antiporter NhaA [Thermoanaerobaculia bacterium]
MRKALKDFLELESASGLLLMGTTVLALAVANSPLAGLYGQLIELPLEIRVGPLFVGKPLLLWINDGLMAGFFLLVGLELKRELVEGQLADRRRIALPFLGAIGGMAAPAAIYVWINWGDPVAMQGWAIPAATDIAFALGILSLLGDRVPVSLKVLLTSVAIFDDIGAIVIIAVFYTASLSIEALLIAAGCLVALFVLNRLGITEIAPYVGIGSVMWLAVLKSGVHATLAGVALAMFIPLRDPRDPERSPLRTLEHDLHTAVAFGVLPLFAFVNAGLSLRGVTFDQLLHGVPLGVAAGLVLGKMTGVFGCFWIAIRLGAPFPDGVRYLALWGAATLCGVGFTMSLFIGSLAFEQTGVNQLFDERLGILVGSLVSGLLGYAILRLGLRSAR